MDDRGKTCQHTQCIRNGNTGSGITVVNGHNFHEINLLFFVFYIVSYYWEKVKNFFQKIENNS
jgi:hypothetical protein